jgi:Spy/CpxP family protein refolding chaperone
MRGARNNLIVIVTVILAVAGSAAAAGAADFRMPRGRWWESPRVVQEIGLTPDQQEQIHQLVYKHAEVMIGLNADVKRAELRLGELARNDRFDERAVRAAWTQYQEARRKLENERFELLVAIRKVLTAEQWKKLDEMRRQFEQRRRHPRDRQRPGRNPYRPPAGQPPAPPGPGMS